MFEVYSDFWESGLLRSKGTRANVLYIKMQAVLNVVLTSKGRYHIFKHTSKILSKTKNIVEI